MAADGHAGHADQAYDVARFQVIARFDQDLRLVPVDQIDRLILVSLIQFLDHQVAIEVRFDAKDGLQVVASDDDAPCRCGQYRRTGGVHIVHAMVPVVASFYGGAVGKVGSGVAVARTVQRNGR